MILIPDDIKNDDLVYFWYSDPNDRKKGTEHEFKVHEKTPNYIKFHSVTGDYDLIFTTELLGKYNGSCRKV